MDSEKSNATQSLYLYLKRVTDRCLPLAIVDSLDKYYATGKSEPVYDLGERILRDVDATLMSTVRKKDAIYTAICGIALMVSSAYLNLKGYDNNYNLFLNISSWAAIYSALEMTLNDRNSRKNLIKIRDALSRDWDCSLLLSTLDRHKDSLSSKHGLESKVA